MTTNTDSSTFETILSNQKRIFREAWQEGWYLLFVGFVLVVLGFLAGRGWFNGEDAGFGYRTNIYTEALSVLATVLIVDVLYRWRDKRRRMCDLREQLVRDAASVSNEIAKDGVHQLRRQNWLLDDRGLLQGANLKESNLSQAQLWKANLSGANLWGADLSDAKLWEANLSGAKLGTANLNKAELWKANVSGANLYHAKLSGADLTNANLTKANLVGANLSDADLKSANLSGAHLRSANLENTIWHGEFDVKLYSAAILPDGTKWTPETDMRKFTHPDEYEGE
jgi:hypothetical protein